jgi:hypothetical protein
VRADQKLTAFLELESAVCIHLLSEQIKKNLRTAEGREICVPDVGAQFSSRICFD